LSYLDNFSLLLLENLIHLTQWLVCKLPW
jgi:hypothetical protein